MTFEKAKLPQVDSFSAHTVAQLKGRRLRMARALTGFSRQELYEKIGIATSTIDTWESGRVELTEKSAMRICSALMNVGLYCTSDWLLTGNGVPPRLMDEIEKSIFLTKGRKFLTENSTAPLPSENLAKFESRFFSCLDENASRELSFFMSLHKNAIFHVVENDFLSSRYKVGDCVAGLEEDANNLLGKIVIAVLKNEKTLLCKLLSCSGSECVVFLNSNNSRKRISIERAAEVIWHRTIKRLTF